MSKNNPTADDASMARDSLCPKILTAKADDKPGPGAYETSELLPGLRKKREKERAQSGFVDSLGGVSRGCSSLHFDVEFLPDVRDLVFDFVKSSKRLCQPSCAGPSALIGPEPLPKEEKAPRFRCFALPEYVGFRALGCIDAVLTSCWRQRDDGCVPQSLLLSGESEATPGPASYDLRQSQAGPGPTHMAFLPGSRSSDKESPSFSKP